VNKHNSNIYIVIPFIIYDITTIETIVNSFITITGFKQRVQKFHLILFNYELGILWGNSAYSINIFRLQKKAIMIITNTRNRLL